MAGRNLILSHEAALHLRDNGNKPFRVYSIDAAHRIATNYFDPGATSQNFNFSQKEIQIIPSEQPLATNPAPLGKKRVVLPSKIGVARETGNNNLTLTFGDLFLMASESPLRWDSQNRAYCTTLEIGLDFDPASHVTDLPAPVAFQVFTRNASVNPSGVTITRAGPPYQQVTLSCTDPGADASVTAHNPHIPDKPLKIECARELGKLTVEPVTKKIFGYGLGTTKVRIRRFAKDDFEFADAAELTVTLISSVGKLNPLGSVTILANQSAAEAELRSVGIGSAEITARSGPFSSTEHITFGFPATFLLAALLGGCAGGAGRIFRHRSRKNAIRWKWLLEGSVIGLIVVAAAAAGIVIFNLPTTVLGTELGAFLLGAFSGYAGAPVLDRVVAQTQPAK